MGGVFHCAVRLVRGPALVSSAKPRARKSFRNVMVRLEGIVIDQILELTSVPVWRAKVVPE